MPFCMICLIYFVCIIECILMIVYQVSYTRTVLVWEKWLNCVLFVPALICLIDQVGALPPLDTVPNLI